MSQHSSDERTRQAPGDISARIPAPRQGQPRRSRGRHVGPPEGTLWASAEDGAEGTTRVRKEHTPRFDQCPRCGARVRPVDTWCGQCHLVFTEPEPTPADAEDTVLTTPEDAESEDRLRTRSREDLVGGEVSEELIAQMMVDLSADSDSAVPARLLVLTSRWSRTGLAVVGGFAVVTVLLLLLGILGLFL